MEKQGSETLGIAQVEHVARLSRLKLSAGDAARYAKELSGILDFVNQLAELNVDGLEPMSHPLPLHNVMREDVVEPSLGVEKVLQNAPGRDGPFFTVPKVLDTGMGGG
jgi:aspartyl-tRNA(Asn)/glutamyl-tRNA(Gln) amidotransferase subunit C